MRTDLVLPSLVAIYLVGSNEVRADATCADVCGTMTPQFNDDGSSCFCFETCGKFGVCCPGYEDNCFATPAPTEDLAAPTEPTTSSTAITPSTTRRGGVRPVRTTATTTTTTTTTTELKCEGIDDPSWCAAYGCIDPDISWLFKSKCRATCGTCPTTTSTTTTATTITDTTITTSSSSSTTTTTTTTTSSTSSSTTTTVTTLTTTSSTSTTTTTTSTITTTSTTSSSTTTVTHTTSTTVTTTTTCTTDGLQLLGVVELNALALPTLITNALAHEIRQAVVSRVNTLLGTSNVAFAVVDECAVFTAPQATMVSNADDSGTLDMKLSMTVSVFFVPGGTEISPLDVWTAGATVEKDVTAGTFAIEGSFSPNPVGALGFAAGVFLPSLDFVLYGHVTAAEAACTTKRGAKTLCVATTNEMVLVGGASGLGFKDVIDVAFVPRALGILAVSVKFLPGNEDVVLAIRSTLENCDLNVMFGDSALAAQPTEWAQQTCGKITTTPDPTTTTTATTFTATAVVSPSPFVEATVSTTTTAPTTSTPSMITTSVTTSTITFTPAGPDDCNTIQCPAKCIKICGWSSAASMCITGGETSVEEILTLGVCAPAERTVDADVFSSGDGTSNDDLVNASESNNATADTTYTLIFIIVAAVLGAVLVGIGLLMIGTRENPSSDNQKQVLPTIADLSREDMARQVMADYEAAYRSLDSSQLGPLAGASPNHAEINNMPNLYGSPPQNNQTSYSPTYSPSPIKLADPPLGAKRRAARETQKVGRGSGHPSPLLDIVSKAQANQAASSAPVDYSDLRYDDGEGPYTFDQFVDFYGEEDAKFAWDDAEHAKPGAVAKASPSSSPASKAVLRSNSLVPKLGSGILLPPAWLHARLDRKDVERLLQEEDGSFENGVFLVRKHASKSPAADNNGSTTDSMVLSCNYKGTVTHHRITQHEPSTNSQGGFGIKGNTYGTYSKTLEDLIALFCHEPLPNGWPLLLTRGVARDTDQSSRV